MKINLSLFVALLALLSTACTNDSKPTQKHIEQCSIEKIKFTQKASFGDTIHFKVNCIEPIQSIEFKTQDQPITVVSTSNNAFKGVVNKRVGAVKIPFVVALTNGTKIAQEQHLVVFSNIKPELKVLAPSSTTRKHNTDYFTQGLVFDGETLLESTGLKGKSRVIRYSGSTPKVEKTIENHPSLFGEGIALVGDSLFQITWQSRVGFVYNKNTLEKLFEFNYDTEGWGLTYTGKSLVMSDGSNSLYFRNPTNFAFQKAISVYDNERAVTALNELEYYNGIIYANIYESFKIAAIEASTGRVLKYFDGFKLINIGEIRNADVMNGIAIDSLNNKVMLTGKLWPRMFEIPLDSIAVN